MITSYDPNIPWARHSLEVTFMQWDYSVTMQVDVRGNCKGASIFESAISVIFDELFDDELNAYQIILKRPAEDGDGEDTLEVDLEAIEELESLCVSVRIVKHEKEGLNDTTN